MEAAKALHINSDLGGQPSFVKALTIGLVTSFLLALSSPAEARRTVIDQTGPEEYGGYCSPFEAQLGSSECNPVPLGFGVNLGGQIFNSVVVHSNGVLSFGGPIAFDAFGGSLESYGAPLFVPFLDNREFGSVDGAYVGRVLATDEHLRVVWSQCFFSAPSCMTEAFGLTLIPGEDGFIVTFTKGSLAPTGSGTYGFSLPGGTFQASGPLVERTFAFDANGSQISAAVPEPTTWAMMLVGFGFVGMAMRSTKRRKRVKVSYA